MWKDIILKSSNLRKIILWRKISSNRFNFCPTLKNDNSELAESIFYAFAKILMDLRLSMKLDKLGLCFLSLKVWLTYKNPELSFFSVVQSINSELGILSFHSKHDSMCERKIPSYCFCVYSKKAITRNSPDREFGVFRRYQVIVISLG